MEEQNITAPAEVAEAVEATEVGESAQAETKAPKTKKKPMDVSRRTLLIGAGSTVALLGLGALRYVGHNPICRPPGGQDESHLVSACIRCERCYEACPQKIIVPAHIEDGLLGMRSPMLEFKSAGQNLDNLHYCDFCAESNNGIPKCVEVCPTGALVLPEGATAENTIIGLAVIDTWQCLAYRDTWCRQCYEACPYDAIALSADGKDARVTVIADKCNGCGACESSCLSLTAGSVASGATQVAIKVVPLASLE